MKDVDVILIGSYRSDWLKKKSEYSNLSPADQNGNRHLGTLMYKIVPASPFSDEDRKRKERIELEGRMKL